LANKCIWNLLYDNEKGKKFI